jgi:hypothetical protein
MGFCSTALSFPVHEVPHRPAVDLQTMFGKPAGQALQGHIAICLDLPQHARLVLAPDLSAAHARRSCLA